MSYIIEDAITDAKHIKKYLQKPSDKNYGDFSEKARNSARDLLDELESVERRDMEPIGF